jgi:hypothetical protein
LWYIIDNRGGSLNGDTLDKIDEAIKKLQGNEVSTEVEVIKEDTDTKIFNNDVSNSNDLDKTMEFDGILKEVEITSDVKKKNNDTLIIVLYVFALVITVLLVTAFILFLY